MLEVPFTYLVDQLAQRWGVPPWAIEEAPPGVDPDKHLDWVIRGLEFQRIEGPVTSG